MKAFVSWSGKYSREVASILKKYLPCILQGLDVFMSQHDLESGERWGNKLANELNESEFGIICLTNSNLNSPWILFEAGALTKQFDGRACSLLLDDLSATDITGPLSQFQNRKFERSEILKLVIDLNKNMQKPMSESQLGLIFDKWYPDISNEYNKVTEDKTEEPTTNVSVREDRELLEEILTKVRGLNSKPSLRERNMPEEFLSFVIDAISDNSKDILIKIVEFRENGDHASKNALIAQYPEEIKELSRHFLIKVEDGEILVKSEIHETASYWLG
ncbi:MAG: toll/interleukin-1 receptor domain-containing protein [Immundisolibacteraceae bacterium]|nr:toll/interleukin-1 receptor domain-containing protein [Immundisolibacteraceae bacterium]